MSAKTSVENPGTASKRNAKEMVAASMELRCGIPAPGGTGETMDQREEAIQRLLLAMGNWPTEVIRRLPGAIGERLPAQPPVLRLIGDHERDMAMKRLVSAAQAWPTAFLHELAKSLADLRPGAHGATDGGVQSNAEPYRFQPSA